MLEAVVNVSEGRDLAALEVVARPAGRLLLDLHRDPDHNRSVLTLAGPEAARSVSLAAVLRLGLQGHRGVHPRLGVVDVVPFVPLGTSTMQDALAERDAFAEWLGGELGVPCFCYGPERTLPEVRRRAFVDLAPDTGPDRPHPTAGATCVGARGVLVAYNIWVADGLRAAKAIAAELRGPAVRALGLDVGGTAQVSMNLIDPEVVGPADVFDAVAAEADVIRAELVGLVPNAVLETVPPHRWDELDLAADRTIEARLTAAGLTLD